MLTHRTGVLLLSGCNVLSLNIEVYNKRTFIKVRIRRTASSLSLVGYTGCMSLISLRSGNA